MTDTTPHRATAENWDDAGAFASDTRACILELRARVEKLESSYETMRLATLEWGKDVDKLMRWSDQHLQRIERLEAGATCPHIRSSDEGTSYCALAEQTAAAQPAPAAAPAPAEGLVEWVHNAILAVEDDDDEDDPSFKYTSAASRIGQGLVDLQARAAIREVAAWLRSGDAGAGHAWELVAVLLEQEANRG